MLYILLQRVVMFYHNILLFQQRIKTSDPEHLGSTKIIMYSNSDQAMELFHPTFFKHIEKHGKGKDDHCPEHDWKNRRTRPMS